VGTAGQLEKGVKYGGVERWERASGVSATLYRFTLLDVDLVFGCDQDLKQVWRTHRRLRKISDGTPTSKLLTYTRAQQLQYAQAEADHKPHLYGASLNDANVAAHVDKEVLEKHESHSSSASVGAVIEDEDGLGGVRPTAEELKTLRKVGEPLPKAAFLVAIVELCERFTYYGASGIFQNYISRPRTGELGRGALGMGPKGATGLSTFFQFWCYVTPILGAGKTQKICRYRCVC
tara:strand:- start:3319 stop:4020 length:702 start_codon:yes stop_codon:yes gene_type:complete